jgi:hypothetical protein
MGTFLQIVGALCVGGVLVAVVGFLILRWTLKRKFAEAMHEFGNEVGFTQPLQIEVVPDLVTWSDAPKMEQETNAMIAAGFAMIGDFKLRDSFHHYDTPMKLRAFHHEAWNAYGVIYEMAPAGIWVDIWQSFGPDRTYTLTSAPEGEAVTSRPGREKVYRKGASAAQLAAEFPTVRPQETADPCPPNSFASIFAKEYNDYMDWVAVKGGPSEEEVRRVALESGNEVDDAAVKFARQMAVSQSRFLLNARIKEKFLDSGQVTARQWDEMENTYLVVHDLLDGDELHALIQGIAYKTLPAEAFDAPDALSAHEKFALIVERVSADIAKLTSMGKVSEPVNAEFFRYEYDPNRDFEDEEEEDFD